MQRDKNKKKIVGLLAGIVVIGCALVLCSGRGDEERPALENPKLGAGSVFANEPNFLSNRAEGPSSGELFFKMMLSVALVVALGIGAIYISKKFLPKIVNLPGKEIRIVETTHLGPRKMIHLLNVGNRRLLIGSTNERITMLADVTGSSMDFSVENMDMAESVDGRQAY